MNHISTSASDRRQNYRLAIHHQSRLILALDGPEPADDAIHGVTLTDISQDGLMASDAGKLVPGACVLLEVPLVGWREAEVRWIAGNRAGCRFTEALSLDELQLAAVSSQRLAGECPALAAQIARFNIVEAPSPAPSAPKPIPRLASWSAVMAAGVAIALASFLLARWLFAHLG